MYDYMFQSGQPALMSLNVGIMNDEIISIPKTRFDKNDVVSIIQQGFAKSGNTVNGSLLEILT